MYNNGEEKVQLALALSPKKSVSHCTRQHVSWRLISPLCCWSHLPPLHPCLSYPNNSLSLLFLLQPSPPHRALQSVFGGNRTLMLTRSSFPGVGKYSGHWLGDNGANWNDIKWAIPGMLEFGLFGIPYVSTKPPRGKSLSTLCSR